VLFGFLSVDLATSFNYSMNSMTIDIVLLIFFLFDHVEVLRSNCQKKWRLVQLRNLFLEFNIPFIFHVMSIFFFLI
jgi:hypothetical protein